MFNDWELQEMITSSFFGKGEMSKRQAEYYAAVATRIALLRMRYFMLTMGILTIGGAILISYVVLTIILWRVIG
jgi:hypothetical protein